MAIILQSTEKENVEVWFTENEEKLIYRNIKNMTKENSRYIANSTIWDCAGDIALTVYINQVEGKSTEYKDKNMVLYPSSTEIENAHFYSPATLLKVFSKLKDWQIVVKETKKEEVRQMSNEIFKVECPAFEGDNWNTDYKTQHGKTRRDYAHPVDSGIIKILDNKLINSVFKPAIDMACDLQQGDAVATGVIVGDGNYPEIDKIVNECVSKLGINRPYVVVTSSISGINAMTFGSDEEPYIAISPLMIKTMSEEQLKFVIGHECGHIAMGHVVYHSVINAATNFASTIPVLAPVINAVGTVPLMAWSRRSEISADRAGLLCCGDAEIAKRTLLQITMPFMDADEINIDKYVEDSSKYLKKGLLRKANELSHAHPIIPKRIHALDEFVKSKKYFNLIEKTVPAEAYTDRELESKIEDIIKVF